MTSGGINTKSGDAIDLNEVIGLDVCGFATGY